MPAGPAPATSRSTSRCWLMAFGSGVACVDGSIASIPPWDSGGLSEASTYVMAGHSRSKNGVASLACVPAIHVLLYLSHAWRLGLFHDKPAQRYFVCRGYQQLAAPRLRTP